VISGAFSESLAIIFTDLIEVRIRVTKSGPRKNPVEVRVRELAHIAAGETFVARRRIAGTEDSLSEPNGEALLAYSARALEEHAARQSPGGHALR
jgi:hypothetical protein